MLTVKSLRYPEEKKGEFERFDPLVGSWVVSDLRSKIDLSQALLRERDFLPGQAVMRASELWKTLLLRLRPEQQIVTREFATALIAEALDDSALTLDREGERNEWMRSPGAAGTTYEYMTQLMPLIAHERGEEMTEAWLDGHPEARSRWGRWHTLARAMFTKFVKEGFLAPPWAAGVLVNEIDLASTWNRPLTFDLGAELTQVEADLIASLAERVDVTVLKPAPDWALEYGRALQPYEIFTRTNAGHAAVTSESVRMPDSVPQKRRYKKLTTMIAEAKDAVAQARVWLDEGARPEEVAIVAPDVEVYWSALSACLNVEGIHAQKRRVARLHSFPDITRLLALLRLRSGSNAEADLELCLFTDSGHRPLGFDRFKSPFTAGYGREDFARSADVHELFKAALDENARISRDEFVAWVLKQADDGMNQDRLETLLRRLYSEAPEPTRLAVKRWVSYLSHAAARIEIAIDEGRPDGISVIGLISAESSPCTKMAIIGLSEAALRSGAETAVLFADVLSIAYEFGFHLPHADRAKLEFETRWTLENSTREYLLTTPETDFTGTVQASAWIWTRAAIEAGVPHGRASAPRETRWDELQRATSEIIAHERGWSEAEASLTQNSMLEDLNLQALPAYGMSAELKLSASAIEDYLACPFIFAAKRLFLLSDQPNLDMDVDAATRGRLMHAVLERLSQEPFRTDWTADEISELIDQARVASETELADERLWTSLKARHIELARRFLASESEWRARFPQTKTIATEAKIFGYVDADSGRLVAKQPARGVPFRGYIDRVDVDDSGNAAVIDYKSSAFGVSSFATWIEKDRLQLLLYSAALENGLTELEPKPVVNAAYYVARTMNRDAGFKIKDTEQGLYDLADRKRNQATLAQKNEMTVAAAEKTRAAVERMLAGDFRPAPKDPQECPECRWKRICRAPHLN